MSITYTSIASLFARPFQRLTSAMWNTAILLLDQLYLTGGNAVTSILQNGNLYIPNSINALIGNFSEEVYVQGQPVLTEQDPIYIAGFISTAQKQIYEVIQSNYQLYELIAQTPDAIYKAVISSVPSATKSVYESITSLDSLIYNIALYLVNKETSISKSLDNLLYNLALYFIATVNNASKSMQNIINNVYGVVGTATEGLYNSITQIADLLLYALTYIYLAQVGLTNTLNKLSLYLAPPTIEGLKLSVGTSPAPLYNGPAITTLKIILQNLSNYIVYLGNSLYNSFPLLPNDSIEINISNPKNIYAWATGQCTVYALFEVVESG